MSQKQKETNEELSQRMLFWLLVASFGVVLVIAITALRNNNQTMVKLRAEVYAADQAGKDVNQPLNNLRNFVYGHMNTSLASGPNAIKPPIQLKNTYERLEKAEEARVAAANSQIYTDAQNYCQSLNSVDFSGRNRVPCVQEYVTAHGVQPQAIPTALYQFDFVSPSWSPDLAGWSLAVLTILGLFLAVVLLFPYLAAKKAFQK